MYSGAGCIKHTVPCSDETLSPALCPHSPYQDDFVVVHVRDEYDSVLETVLKTEFLTLLSEKYTTLTRSTLTVHFGRRSV